MAELSAIKVSSPDACPRASLWGLVLKSQHREDFSMHRCCQHLSLAMSKSKFPKIRIRLGPVPAALAVPYEGTPLFLILDASMAEKLNEPFSEYGNDTKATLREAMTKGRPIIICVPPPEMMLIDHRKVVASAHNKAAAKRGEPQATRLQEPEIKGYEGAGMGYGITKQYPNMKYRPWGRQTFEIDVVGPWV